jgi:hypothetical protein
MIDEQHQAAEQCIENPHSEGTIGPAGSALTIQDFW